MNKRSAVAFQKDRAVVEAMRLAGAPADVIDEFLACLELNEAEREELRRIGRPESADIASGDVIDMNPLLSQPQRSKPR